MYKLIVSDVDGTLLRDDRTIGEKTREAIRAAHERGVRFCISSGRFLSGLTFLGDQLGIPVLYSCVNGAVITDGDRTIARRSFPAESYSRVMAEALGKVEAYMAFGEKEYAFQGNDWWFDYQTKLYGGKSGIRMDLSSPKEVEEALGEPVLKILMKDRDTVKLRGLMDHLKSTLPGTADFTMSGPYAFEATTGGVNKGSAIELLASYLGIGKDEIIVFGDYNNDASMFENAGFPVAMGNAVPELKEKAAFTTLSNNEDGIAYALEKFVLS